jgi:hypothetical protein
MHRVIKTYNNKNRPFKNQNSQRQLKRLNMEKLATVYKDMIEKKKTPLIDVLIYTIMSHDFKDMVHIITRYNVDINSCTFLQNYPILVAIQVKNIPAIKFLCARGNINLDITSKIQQDPVIVAAIKTADLNVVQEIFKHPKVKKSLTNRLGYGCLKSCMLFGNEEIFAYLTANLPKHIIEQKDWLGNNMQTCLQFYKKQSWQKYLPANNAIAA